MCLGASGARDEIDRFRTLALFIGLDIERNALAFVQAVNARTLQRADMHEHIRSAGIRLYTADEFKNLLEVPQLYINVNELALHGAQAGLFTYNATTEVRQAVKLARDSTISSTTVTWRAPATVGTVGSVNFRIAVRDVVREGVDLLITAYQAVNPRRRAP